MTDYQKGKIYKLFSIKGDCVYYGSTTRNLNRRFNEHKSSHLHNRNKKKVFLYDDVKIELVEQYPCNSKAELLKRERYYIENNNCINLTIPNRTDKEWRNMDIIKEQQKEYFKKYHINNKDKIIKRVKEYEKNNKEKVNNYRIEYRKKNREKINKKYNEKFNCECGGRYSYSSKKRHSASKKHIKFITKE